MCAEHKVFSDVIAIILHLFACISFSHISYNFCIFRSLAGCCFFFFSLLITCLREKKQHIRQFQTLEFLHYLPLAHGVLRIKCRIQSSSRFTVITFVERPREKKRLSKNGKKSLKDKRINIATITHLIRCGKRKINEQKKIKRITYEYFPNKTQ